MNMNCQSVEINRSEFKDLKHTQLNQHFYVEVAMIDQNPTGSMPVLYQLNNERFSEDLDFLRQEFISLPHPAFTLLGEVKEIHMSKKSLTLRNGQSVTYKYLILVAGVDQKDEEATVLHTLKDALMIDVLNVKDKIQEPRQISSFLGKLAGKHKKSNHSFCVPSPHAPHLKRNIEKFACDRINETEQIDPFVSLTPSQKKLCFLQM